MWLLLIGILLLFITGIIAFAVSKLSRKKENSSSIRETPSDCCGAHEVCEKGSLLSKTNQIIYFDDEELDELAGIPTENFSKIQLEKLEHVFYTLQESDVAGWIRSLQLRNINLPSNLKDEALLIVRERRHL